MDNEITLGIMNVRIIADANNGGSIPVASNRNPNFSKWNIVETIFSTIFFNNLLSWFAHGFEACIPVFGRKVAFVFQDHGQAFVECRVGWCYTGESIYQAVVKAEEGGYKYGVVYFAVGGVVVPSFLCHGSVLRSGR